MKLAVFSFILFISQSLFSQSNCSCTTELAFVIDYYEDNLPGFKDNVNSQNQADYEELKTNLLKASEGIESKTECFKILTYFTEYFKDNHSRIEMAFSSINENKKKEVKAFKKSDTYQNREIYSLQKSDLQQFPHTEVKGLYQTADKAYVIAIIPNKTTLRDYIGVIVESKTKLWKKGQIKMELKKNSDGSFQAFNYMRNHSIRYSPNTELRNGILGDSWFKTTKKEFVNHSKSQDRSLEFSMLNDTTAYLKIFSFSGYHTAKLDSFYKTHDAQIRATPNLIIDVRDNGGGSDANAMPLIPYLYTNPLHSDLVELYVTDGNIKMWEQWHERFKKDTVNFSKETIEWLEEEIARMKEAELDTYIPRGEIDSLVLDSVLTYPRSVAIIQNKSCASSCESLLFWAQESSKTILVGENSGGYVGYGEVGSLQTPCFDYTLHCTMTRYQQQRKYEVIGIAPDYKLNYEKDWIEQTLEFLKKPSK